MGGSNALSVAVCASFLALSGCDKALVASNNNQPSAQVPTTGGADTDSHGPMIAGNDAASGGNTSQTHDAGHHNSYRDADARASDAGYATARDASDGAPITPTQCGTPIVNLHPGNPCYNSPPPALKLEQIATGSDIVAPVLLLAAPGDTARLFIVSVAGTIRIIQDGTLRSEPFLDLTDIVPVGSGTTEYGLLGMAFDPDFASNRKIWVHYNIDAQPLQSVTASVLVSPDDPNRADKSSLTPLFTVDQPATNHNGGMINFGPDGCLYVGFGDGGNQNDPHGNGQNNAEPMGAILRLDPTSGLAAPGNPGYMDNRIWVYGLRNPWRWTFDDATSDMYIGDVGQGAWEEYDVAPAGVGGLNYGWDIMEGTHGHENYTGDPTGMRLPAKEYAHGTGPGFGKAAIGGRVYRGTLMPDMVGRYLYGDYVTSNYWVFTYSGETADNPVICDDYDISSELAAAKKPTAFGQDASGELYITTFDNGIFKIEPGP